MNNYGPMLIDYSLNKMVASEEDLQCLKELGISL